MGINPYADLTFEEFKLLCGLYGFIFKLIPQQNLNQVNVNGLPETVDWRTKGVVTPVKTQGQCGSCYAFSATGAIESHAAINTKRLVSLSEQNIVDCSENHGCHGGLMNISFDYVKKNKGIDTEKSYPYEGKKCPCRYKSRSIGATIKGHCDIPSGDESCLQSSVANIGPVSVAIDASRDSMQFYRSGVYYEPLCSCTHLDHGVLVIGYGTEDGCDYWLVKNQWGVQWGENGYIKISRNCNNHCGIATAASYPTGAKN